MNTSQFAEVMDTTPRNARKFLRSVTPKDDQPGKGSRWELPEGKRELNAYRKQFNSWKAAQEAKAAEKAEEVADEEIVDEA